MDDHTRYVYRLQFMLAFLSKNGNEFEDWFSEIMELRYPGDFTRVSPWGADGDQKNDGYLRSKRMLFQVYAPETLQESRALRKIAADHAGAIQYWKEYFDTWVFVHNRRKGLPPRIEKRLRSLDLDGPPSVESWGAAVLRKEVFELPLTDLQILFGIAPTPKDMQNVQYENFRNVLRYIAGRPPISDGDIRNVPPGKIDSNGFSDETKYIIGLGRRKSSYAGEFFRYWHDPRHGDEVSGSFKSEYARLKNAGESPDDIFGYLAIFSGVNEVTNPRDTMAVYALVTYFFEVCDIFERPMD